MFKPHRIIFTALSLLLFCSPSVFLKASSQSLQQAKLFANRVINTDADEYGPAFMSGGKTLYFTRRVNRRDSEFIYISRLESGKWSAPALAPFSGKYFDKEPFVAPDGKRIFFASLRPVDGVEPKNRRDFNIWFVEKTASGWSEPRQVGPAINSPAYENYPSVAANGTLYFAGEREGGKGGNDLYRARLINGKYERVERLDELNTPNVDADPYIAPDESYLIFCSNRPGGCVIKDAEFMIPWDSKKYPAKNNMMPEWNRDQTLRSAIKYSVLWYYRELAKSVGDTRMKDWVTKFDYGNQDTSGGIDQFWLRSSLRISADEQIEFLKKLYREQLPVSKRSLEIVKDILTMEKTAEYKLSAKTGTGPLSEGKYIGWFVGYLESKGNVYFFALNLNGDKAPPSRERRINLTKRILTDLGYLPRQ